MLKNFKSFNNNFNLVCLGLNKIFFKKYIFTLVEAIINQ